MKPGQGLYCSQKQIVSKDSDTFGMCSIHYKGLQSNSICMLGNFACFLSSEDFFKINFLKKKFRNTINVKQFPSTGSELLAKVISRGQKSPVANILFIESCL